MNPVEGAGCSWTHSGNAPTAFYEVRAIEQCMGAHT